MTSQSKAALTTIVLLACAMPLMRRAEIVAYDPQPPVAERLPAQTGPWVADVFSYCSNTSCGAVWRRSQLGDASTCPKCGGQLVSMAPIERALLPPDTLLERAEYRAAAGDGLVATLVCSGRDRSSIHRPEMCLSGDVTDTREISIDLPGRGPLSLRLLTLVRGQGGETGQFGKTTMYYAYWFTSGEHETSSHIERMMLMASDRVFHGVARRWAYVSVAGKMPANGDPTPQLREFLREFVPQLAPR